MMGLDTMKSIGNYDLVEKIAEGGMGTIYRGRRRDDGGIVAIKIMASHLTRNPLLLKRFEQEFLAASRLSHPNIVRALDFGNDDNTPYLVMEFVEGESLGQKLEREGRMSEVDSIRLIAQVAQGLHRAHKQNLIHRDVKPDNILVTKAGAAKLADLGLVKTTTDTDLNLTRTGRGLGTPHFMAPEQFRNAKNADIHCDVYSLAATLYQMVTGEVPFRSNGPLDAWMKKIQNELIPPRQIVPGLSERVDRAIRRALLADPEKRPASCREFIEDLTGKSTQRLPAVDSGFPQQDLWYLVYRDENGTPHTVKGTMSAVRRSLKDGLLGDASNVRASRTKAGPFEALREHAEFRDLMPEAAATPSSSPSTSGSKGGVSKRPAPAPSTDAAPARQPSKQKATRQSVAPDKPPKQRTQTINSPWTNRKVLKWLLFIVLLLILTAAIGIWFIKFV
ncbi:MAG: serine/threonine protein kinase [Gemmataceae bacterium]